MFNSDKINMENEGEGKVFSGVSTENGLQRQILAIMILLPNTCNIHR